MAGDGGDPKLVDQKPGDQRDPAAKHWGVLHSGVTLGVVALWIWWAIWPPDWGMRTFWLWGIAALTLLTVVAGSGVTGNWRGAFIDDRLKMSLSRLQLLAWTILILSAFGAIAIARVRSNPLTSLDIGVPETIWALLGISATSLLGSPLIKNSRKQAPTPSNAQKLLSDQGQSATSVEIEGQVVKNTDISQASMADLFRGEYVNNVALLDLGKIQMFFFTLVLILAYGFAVNEALQAATAPASLPDVGEGMLPLLGISHAGYLANKVVTSPAPTT